MTDRIDQPRAGIYHGVPYAEYKAWDAVNWSKLKHIAKSPLHCTVDDDTDSAARILGRGVHCALLEPEAFNDRYPLWEGHKAGKDYDAFKAKLDGHDAVISPDTEQQMLAMARAARNLPDTGRYFRGEGYNEVSMVWEEFGQLWKLRADRICDVLGWPTVVEVKTTGSAEWRKFGLEIDNNKYDLHAAFAARACRALFGGWQAHVFIAIETKGACVPGAHRYPAHAVECLDIYVQGMMERWVECKRSNFWPGYPELEAYVPAYKVGEYEQ